MPEMRATHNVQDQAAVSGEADEGRGRGVRKIIVKQDIESPLPTEILAESIKSISDGIKKLRSGRLNETALLLLIKHAAPTVKTGKYTREHVTPKQVRAVLEGMEQLEREYLKPRKQ
jgi:hypothetical protein